MANDTANATRPDSGRLTDEELEALWASVDTDRYKGDAVTLNEDAIAAEPTPERGSVDTLISSGARSIDNTQGLMYGVGALGADLAGMDKTRDWMLDGYQKNKVEADQNKAEVGTYKNVDSVGKAGTYALETIGELVPTMATILAGSLTGGLAGGAAATSGAMAAARGAAPAFLKKLMGKQVTELVGKGYAEAEAKALAGKYVGNMVGAWAASSGLESGSMYTEDVEEFGVENASPGRALGLGMASGATDVAFGAEGMLIKAWAGKFGKNAAGAVGEAIAKESAKSLAGKSVVKGITGEGGQEMLQEGTAMVHNLLSDMEATGRSAEDILAEKGSAYFDRAVDAGLKGAVGGAGMGGVSHGFNKLNETRDEIRRMEGAQGDVSTLTDLDARMAAGDNGRGTGPSAPVIEGEVPMHDGSPIPQPAGDGQAALPPGREQLAITGGQQALPSGEPARPSPGAIPMGPGETPLHGTTPFTQNLGLGLIPVTGRTQQALPGRDAQQALPASEPLTADGRPIPQGPATDPQLALPRGSSTLPDGTTVYEQPAAAEQLALPAGQEAAAKGEAIKEQARVETIRQTKLKMNGLGNKSTINTAEMDQITEMAKQFPPKSKLNVKHWMKQADLAKQSTPDFMGDFVATMNAAAQHETQVAQAEMAAKQAEADKKAAATATKQASKAKPAINPVIAPVSAPTATVTNGMVNVVEGSTGDPHATVLDSEVKSPDASVKKTGKAGTGMWNAPTNAPVTAPATAVTNVAPSGSVATTTPTESSSGSVATASKVGSRTVTELKAAVNEKKAAKTKAPDKVKAAPVTSAKTSAKVEPTAKAIATPSLMDVLRKEVAKDPDAKKAPVTKTIKANATVAETKAKLKAMSTKPTEAGTVSTLTDDKTDADSKTAARRKFIDDATSVDGSKDFHIATRGKDLFTAEEQQQLADAFDYLGEDATVDAVIEESGINIEGAYDDSLDGMASKKGDAKLTKAQKAEAKAKAHKEAKEAAAAKAKADRAAKVGADVKAKTEATDKAKVAAISKPKSTPLITRAQQVFGPKAKYTQIKGTGSVIVVTPNGSAVLIREDNVLFADNGGEANGLWENSAVVEHKYDVKLTKGGIMRLAKDRKATTALHEEMHAAISLSLNATERKLLFNKYRDEKKGITTTRQIEEAIAEAYQVWNPKVEPSKGFFGKIWSLAKGIKNLFIEQDGPSTPDGVFKKVRDHGAWSSNGGRDVGKTVADVISGSTEAMASRLDSRLVTSKSKGKAPADGNQHMLQPSFRMLAKSAKFYTNKAGNPTAVLLQQTTTGNAAGQIKALDAILKAHPNPTADEQSWASMMAMALGTHDVPMAPYNFIKRLNSNKYGKILKSLGKGQVDGASRGFDNARRLKLAYASGDADVTATGKLFMWSYLSKGVSPYSQEGLFLDAVKGVERFVKMAAKGKFGKAEQAEYAMWAEKVAAKGSGVPGAGAKHNLNSFGHTFLAKMAEQRSDGRTHLQWVHDMFADPTLNGHDIRRRFALESPDGVGLDNKVLSFTLLVSGRTDVMVIDRIQAKALFNDGRFGDVNIYDGEKTETKTVDGVKIPGGVVPGTSTATMFNGVRGMLLYEAMERALSAKINDIYTEAGRPNDASIGRWHWETWDAASQQEADHATLDAILYEIMGVDNPYDNVFVNQGEYGTYDYNTKYGYDGDTPVYIVENSMGEEYVLSIDAYSTFKADIKKAKSNVLDKPSKFRVSTDINKNDRTEGWYHDDRVNREALDALIAQKGKRASKRYIRKHGEGESADGTRPAGPESYARENLHLGEERDGKDRIVASRSQRAAILKGYRKQLYSTEGAGTTGTVARTYTRGNRRTVDVNGHTVSAIPWTISSRSEQMFSDVFGMSTPKMLELKGDNAADVFREAISTQKAGLKYGACVYVYGAEDYATMRTFLSEDGKSGFALKGKDIVSVFGAADKSNPGFATPILHFALQEGGRKLDAFDTVLPGIYADAGFTVVNRLKWDENEKPEGWDKEVYKKHNNGEPDVVFMAYDRERNAPYKRGEGDYADDYGAAVSRQDETVELGDLQPMYSHKGTVLADMMADNEAHAESLGKVFGPKHRSVGDKAWSTLANAYRGDRTDLNAYKDLMFGWMRKNIFDVYDRINVLGKVVDADGGTSGKDAYQSMRLATSVDSVMSAFLQHGGIAMNNGVSMLTSRDQGLIPLMAKLGDDKWYWMVDRVARRAQRFLDETYVDDDGNTITKENLLTQEDIDALNEVTAGRRETNADLWDEADTQFEALQQSVLDFGVANGTINKDAMEVWHNADYIPFYRILTDAFGDEAAAVGIQNGRKIVSGIKKLQGGKSILDDPLTNIVKNWSIIVTQSLKNNARVKSVDMALQLGDDIVSRANETQKGQSNIINIMRDGKDEYYSIHDKDFFDALTVMPSVVANNGIMKLGQHAKRWLTYGATFTPDFRAANFFRDTVQTMSLNKGYTFGDALSGFVKAWNNHDDYVQLKAAGGAFNSGQLHGTDPASAYKYIEQVSMVNGKEHVTALGKGLAKGKGMLDWWARVGDAAENANRIALYSKLKAQGRSDLDAAYEAKDLLDFSMRGGSQALKMMTSVIPFLNARIAGLYKVRRSVVGDKITDIKPEFYRMAGMLTTASALLMAYNKATSGDEWDKLKDHDKWNYYHFYMGSGKWLRMPKPFEIGAIFSSLPETMFESMSKGDAAVMANFLKFTMTNTFAIDWKPQAIKPIVELWANKSTFTGSDIIPMGMENLAPEFQSKENTKAVAKMIGETLGVAPVQVEHIIQGYTAGLGSMAMTAGDIVLETLGVAPDKPLNTNNLWAVGKFVRDSELSSSQDVTNFYDYARKVDEVTNTMSLLKKQGDAKGYKDYVLDNVDLVKDKSVVSTIKSKFRVLRNKQLLVNMSKTMTMEEKDKQTRAINKSRNDLAALAVNHFKKL